jgi:hypothetical protein
MRVVLLIIVSCVVWLAKAQMDTIKVLDVARLLTISEFESERTVENAMESIVLVDTFKNEMGSGCFGIGNNRYMLLKVISKHCEYILAYDGSEGGKFYKLKGFSSYNPRDIKEIFDDLNFERAPETSFVEELDHLKYCTSALRMWLFKNRIPKSCASIREEEYRKQMRSFRGDIPPR